MRLKTLVERSNSLGYFEAAPLRFKQKITPSSNEDCFNVTTYVVCRIDRPDGGKNGEHDIETRTTFNTKQTYGLAFWQLFGHLDGDLRGIVSDKGAVQVQKKEGEPYLAEFGT